MPWSRVAPSDWKSDGLMSMDASVSIIMAQTGPKRRTNVTRTAARAFIADETERSLPALGVLDLYKLR